MLEDGLTPDVAIEFGYARIFEQGSSVRVAERRGAIQSAFVGLLGGGSRGEKSFKVRHPGRTYDPKNSIPGGQQHTLRVAKGGCQSKSRDGVFFSCPIHLSASLLLLHCDSAATSGGEPPILPCSSLLVPHRTEA
jgi:hypothetical protein